MIGLHLPKREVHQLRTRNFTILNNRSSTIDPITSFPLDHLNVKIEKRRYEVSTTSSRKSESDRSNLPQAKSDLPEAKPAR
jgi:hypothetical protein